jgi:hypothetical protein
MHQGDDQLNFKILECEFPDPTKRLPGLDELEASESMTVRLEL